MRYCGPGDFWSLNFGIYDAPRSNALPIIMGVIAISLAVIGLILVLNWRNDNNKPTGPVIDPAALAEMGRPAIATDGTLTGTPEFTFGRSGYAVKLTEEGYVVKKIRGLVISFQ